MATNSMLTKQTAAGTSAVLTIAAGTSVAVSLIGAIGSTVAYIRKVGSDTGQNQIGQLSANLSSVLVTAGADDMNIVVYKPQSDSAVGVESDGGTLA